MCISSIIHMAVPVNKKYFPRPNRPSAIAHRLWTIGYGLAIGYSKHPAAVQPCAGTIPLVSPIILPHMILPSFVPHLTHLTHLTLVTVPPSLPAAPCRVHPDTATGAHDS